MRTRKTAHDEEVYLPGKCYFTQVHSGGRILAAQLENVLVQRMRTPNMNYAHSSGKRIQLFSHKCIKTPASTVK